MEKLSYVMLADGFEEIEALATVDVLRRAGIETRTMSIKADSQVSGAHGVTVTADLAFDVTALPDAEWVILPGGMPGATNLAACEPLCDVLVKRDRAKKNIAAICASPSIVFSTLGILDGRDATCYPGMENADCKANWTGERVITEAHIITGNGPATAIDFALAIVSAARGEQAADSVAAGMLCR